MHVFVTGGTGFFGKALLRHWATAPEVAGWRFTMLSRNPDRFRHAHRCLLEGLDVRLHRGDIMDAASLPTDPSFTHILHAATDASGTHALTALARFDQIVHGTRHVLELARRLQNPRVLLTSSGGVYGPPPAGVDAIPETWNGMPDPLEPHNAYGVAKRQAEHLCALYQDAFGVESVIARCFAFVGEDLPLDAHYAIGNFIRDALGGGEILVKGDGTPLRSYLDQRDLAHWLTTLLLRGQPRRAYNVGSDEVVSIADLAHAIARECPTSSVRVQRQPVGGAAVERLRYVPDVARARDELGLRVQFCLQDAIAHTLARRRTRQDEVAPMATAARNPFR